MPVVPDAMPGATFEHHVIALTAWLHYGLGITIDQIVNILGYHMQTKLTPGGLIDAWRRLAEALHAWYEQIGEQARKSAHLHAHETGWRVNVVTYWLWCFADARVCYYMIDRCRGSPALQKFFTDVFEGVLSTDFWAAYLAVCAEDREYCLVHLSRELEKVDPRNDSAEWQAFAKKLHRLLRNGIRLRRRPDFAPGKFQSRVYRLNARLASSRLRNTLTPTPGVWRSASASTPSTYSRFWITRMCPSRTTSPSGRYGRQSSCERTASRIAPSVAPRHRRSS